MHTEGSEGELKSTLAQMFFEKFVIKYAIKHPKGEPSPKHFHNPYIPSHPKFGKNLIDPPTGFSNRFKLI
jgi:hypothetical protein